MESVGGSVGTGAGPDLRRGSPPGPGRGIQAFSRESPDAKSRGGGPPPPLVLGAARSHSLVLAWWGAAWRSLDYYGTHVRALIWNLSFAKCFFSIFFQKNASQIGLSIPEGIAPRTDQRERSPKRASDSKRAIKPGVQGACPRPSFSPFLGRNGDPRRAGGAPGALRPEASEKPRPPKGYAVPYHSPARGRAGTHLAGANLRRSKRDHLPSRQRRPHLPKPSPPPAAPPPPLPGEQKGQRKAGRREEELPPGQAQGGQQGSACQAVAQGQQDLHPR